MNAADLRPGRKVKVTSDMATFKANEILKVEAAAWSTVHGAYFIRLTSLDGKRADTFTVDRDDALPVEYV